ncbi:MAG: hypothetical protein WCF84_07290 [Anaerolineae bacterium]
MTSIQLQSHVGSDGILKLQVPVGVVNVDLEVMVIVTPVHDQVPHSTRNTSWPQDFFEYFAGSLPELSSIDPEGDYESRSLLE